MNKLDSKPRALIGLGNPGSKYMFTRHNSGFLILDALADKYHASWRTRDKLDYAEITLDSTPVLLIKPQTFMNNSGAIAPFLAKQGIQACNILVIHDELELPFSKISLKIGGSAKGHNGLKSLIAVLGDQFARLRFGIGRPENKEHVPDYVLQNFSENPEQVQKAITQAVQLIESLYT